MAEDEATVYVVTSGHYSDTKIQGVFSDSARAEAFAKDYCDGGCVLPFKLDSRTRGLDTGLFPYRVYMKENGDSSVHRQYLGEFFSVDDEADPASQKTCAHVHGERKRVKIPSCRDALSGEIMFTLGTTDYLELYVTTWARDEQHAVKITNEIRARLIATGNWREGYSE